VGADQRLCDGGQQSQVSIELKLCIIESLEYGFGLGPPLSPEALIRRKICLSAFRVKGLGFMFWEALTHVYILASVRL